MSQTVIEVDNLSKQYKLGEVGASTLRDEVRRLWFRATGRNPAEHLGVVDDAVPAGRPGSEHEYHWALRDVSFEVARGEIVGIIGHNGAGKSTLLKVLSRVTAPTSGEVRIQGRMASLLEVGTGFHPEMTGRENIYMNGAILGMNRAEIRRKFDEIVAFSEIEKFIDTPVKRYSSGMYVRLAFAVAAHLEPEILVVDEVLAVGDAQFQKKCLGKIGQVSQQGRTVLIVSHNLAVISGLCSRAILLKGGRKVQDGPAQEVVASYVETASDSTGETTWDPDDPKVNNGRLQLLKARTISREKVVAEVEIDQPVTLEIDFATLVDDLNVCSSIHVLDKHATLAFVSGTASSVIGRGVYRHSYTFPPDLLNDGNYSITIFLITNTTRFEVVVRDAVTFVVFEPKGRAEYFGNMAGCVRPKLTVTAVPLDA